MIIESRLTNIALSIRAIFKYAQYFAKRHPKVIDDEKSVEVVVRISESQIFDSRPQSVLTQNSRPQSVLNEKKAIDSASVYS